MTQETAESVRLGVIGHARRVTRDPMVLNSIAIMSSTVLTSVLGYVFWIIVARSFDREVSGTAAATTSAIQATVLIASVGAAAALVEWLPRCADALEWRQRVTTGMFVSVVTALTGSLIVVGVLGVWWSTLPQLASPIGAILFCVACVCSAVGLVIDYIAVSEHRGSLLLTRNMVMCGLRIPLIMVPIAALTPTDSVLLAWTVAAAASLLWAAATFGSRSGHSLRPNFFALSPHLRQMASSLIGQHLITVTAMLAGYLLPVVVFARLSAAANAYFYITWMLGSVFFIISPAVSGALFVEGAAKPAAIGHLVRRCLLVVGGLLAGPMLVYIFGGGLILSLFGRDYTDHGQLLLLLLTVSAIPDAITNVAVSVLRVSNRLQLALALNGGMLVLCVVASWIVLPATGIVGVGICWLASQSIGALWVLAYWRRLISGGAAHITPEDARIAAADVLPVAVESADH
jgi:O-antigen/teichoic acid export membrane protein